MKQDTAVVWITDLGLGQQWSSAERNTIHKALIHTSVLVYSINKTGFLL